MCYIHKISSISHQDTFNKSFKLDELEILDENSELISPEYKNIINPSSLRRLSPILRMSLVNAINCSNELEFDAIIVGTALGCLLDTEKFLNIILSSESETLSPTSFIQSTHNTIGGQISLYLKNHAYNMTFTQNSLSFEVSLIDGISCLNEDKNNVLIGASDEKIDFLNLIKQSLLKHKYPLTNISTFLNLQKSKSENEIKILDVYISYSFKDTIENEVINFIAKNNLTIKDIDLCYSNENINIPFKNIENFLKYSGLNLSASAFAFHMGVQFLTQENNGIVLIINTICKNQLGLILIEK